MKDQPLPPHPSSRNIPSCLLAIPGVEKLTLEGGKFSLQEDGGWMFSRVIIYLHVTASPANPLENVAAALDAMPCCQKPQFSDDLVTLRLDSAGKVIIDGPCRISAYVRDGAVCEGCPRAGLRRECRPAGKAATLKTPEDVKREFAEQGVCVADWARERGFPPHRVYDVLNRRGECTRGITHEIAVELGIKARPAETPAVQ